MPTSDSMCFFCFFSVCISCSNIIQIQLAPPSYLIVSHLLPSLHPDYALLLLLLLLLLFFLCFLPLLPSPAPTPPTPLPLPLPPLPPLLPPPPPPSLEELTEAKVSLLTHCVLHVGSKTISHCFLALYK